MVEIVGVVKLVPDPKLVPPVETLYQLIIPELAVAPNVIVPLPQRAAGVVDDMNGVVLTVATTDALVELQVPDVAST